MAKKTSLLLHDLRVKGHSPTGLSQATMHVYPSTPIDYIITWIKSKASKNGRVAPLSILAHGAENNHGEGGYGIRLGKEGINDYYVYMWNVLKGKIDTIVLYSCGAANKADHVSWDGGGDGADLCSQLAFYSGANVIASTATQYYERSWWDDEIDLGDWEGMVLMYDPRGGCEILQEG